MGQPKLWLSFNGQPLLLRIVERLRSVVSPLIVVAAQDQELPPLPDDVEVVYDPQPDLGPMQGFTAGLIALRDRTEAVFLSACDVPFLRPEFVTRLAELRAGADVCIPAIDGRTYPLSAVYSTTIRPHVEAMLARRELRMRSIAETVSAKLVGIEEFQSVDAEWESLVNVNTPEEYQTALKRIEQLG